MSIRVATAALSKRIFAGHPNRRGDGFRTPRHDVTSDVLRAVIDKIGIGYEETVTENGIPLCRIAILPPPQEPRDE